MKITKDLYKGSLTLLTDFYQLTMAYAYWKAGKAEQEAVFNLFFRKNPFDSGFAIAAGMEYVMDYCESFSCSLCIKKDCHVRQSDFKKQKQWNLTTVATNAKHRLD